MNVRASFVVLVAFSLVLTSLAGCGGGSANLSPGPMPSGETFTGVWHSPQYGTMQIVQTGSAIVGTYERDERRGRIQGTATGDLMRFEWTETREMVAGRRSTTRGRGYFRFSIGGDGDAYLVGEWGHDDNETGGGPWRAARDRRRRPTIDSSGDTSGSSSDAAEDRAEGGGDAFPDSGGSSSGGSRGGSGDDDEMEGLDGL
jgi:hypothetical protein